MEEEEEGKKGTEVKQDLKCGPKYDIPLPQPMRGEKTLKYLYKYMHFHEIFQYSFTTHNLEGGYMAAKISKLQGQFKDEAGNSQERKGIFSGIAIYVNGYTKFVNFSIDFISDPTGEELKRLMVAHGGTYHHYYSRTQTTHIIASNLPNVKVQNMNTDFIVNPNWITESISAGKLLDYKNYLLYTHQNRSQPKLTFGKVSSSGEKICGESLESNEPSVTSESNNTIDEKYLSKNTSTSNDKCSGKSSLSTANPNFLSEFYNNSRLHHISTSGAMFKQYVKELQIRDENFIGREYLKSWLEERGLNRTGNSFSGSEHVDRTIMHIDMDCFFVSVGLINHPELVGQPVAVTHATRNSQPKRNEKEFEKEVNQWKKKYLPNDEVMEEKTKENLEAPKSKSFSLIDDKCSMAEIASCSYEARKRGIKNGMFLGVALKLCPELKTVSYDFEGYTKVSRDLYDIVASYTKNIEAVSCDEMYVDLVEILKECQCSPMDFATCIREQIHVMFGSLFLFYFILLFILIFVKEKTKCACSVGIGPNMVTARLATKKAKPNGQFFLAAGDVEDFMLLQNVTDLPGVGSSMRARLEEKGVITCGDLQNIQLSSLESTFGNKTGKSLYELCRGIDNRPINKEHQRKSVSAEVNYGIRFEGWSDAEKFVSDLSEEASKRLVNVAMKGRNITLKLKVRAKDAPVETAKFMGHGVCDNIAKSSTLSTTTDDRHVIFRECLSLLKQMSVNPKDMRGLGIQVSKLEDSKSSSTVPSIKNFLKLKTSEEESGNSRLSDSFANNTSKSVCHSLHDIMLPEEKEELRANSGKSKLIAKEKNCMNNQFQTELENRKKSVENSATDVAQKTVDMEVLLALPQDLREQVLEEYKSQGYYIPNKSVDSLSPQPGPSNVHINYENIATDIYQSRKTSEVEVVDLEAEDNDVNFENLSYSQIDESFLNALPLDVRYELQTDFQKKKGKIKCNSTATNQISSLPSFTKKKRGGRPKGGGNNGLTGKNDSKNTDVSKVLATENIENNTCCTVVSSSSRSSEEPNLCGETKIDSIKTLIYQWIESCDNPADIDLNILSSFCISLIEAKDLEKLDLVLKFLFSKGSFDWRKGFETILNEVQAEMIKKYEAPLKFDVEESIVTTY
ncbi:DNA repair protein REV1 [Armadillidium nasatum]|uniref:DNA repair protein REV1 n=1 Tax=Armadillidium nasatum TaxID=96803 RepID=A0A5N5SZR6_9CRUS|nr:DNA repair protein REV1 [Armadillidium nasatum]